MNRAASEGEGCLCAYVLEKSLAKQQIESRIGKPDAGFCASQGDDVIDNSEKDL
jgi:hypothetical protein